MSLVIFVPTVFALVLMVPWIFPRGSDEYMRWWSLIGTALTLGFSLCMFISYYQWVVQKGPDVDAHGERERFPSSLLDKRVEEANERADLHEARESRDWVARYAWIPRFNIEYYLGVDGISMPLDPADHGSQLPGDDRELEHRPVRARLLHPVPAPGNRHARHVLRAGLLPVLHLLGSDAAADVLPDRRLGRSAPRVRGHQVLPVHAAGQRLHPDRLAGLLLHRRPRFRHSPRRRGQGRWRISPFTLSTSYCCKGRAGKRRTSSTARPCNSAGMAAAANDR